MLETWQVSLIVGGASLLGTLVGAAISVLTNAQRLRAEERRFWRERIVEHAANILDLTSQTPVPGADPGAVALKALDNLEKMEHEFNRFQLIAPYDVAQLAARMHLRAMESSIQASVESEGEADTRDELKVMRTEFRQAVNKLAGVKSTNRK